MFRVSSPVSVSASLRSENPPGGGGGGGGGDDGDASALGVHKNANLDNQNNADKNGSRGNVASMEGLPPRPLFLDSYLDDAALGIEWKSGRLDGGRRRGTRPSSHLTTSVPLWSGGGGRAVGSPSQRALPRGEGGLWEEEGGAVAGRGDGGGRNGTAAAAMDVLREVERMQVGTRVYDFFFF